MRLKFQRHYTDYHTHDIRDITSTFLLQFSRSYPDFEAMTEQTPRINSLYLEAFTGQTVMITGKVSQIRGETAVIDANGEVTVLLNRVCTPHRYFPVSQETSAFC